MGLSLTILGSGSSGNAALVSKGRTHILLDIGLSGKETARRLGLCGVRPEAVSAIVISHEHVDHCRGLAPFVKKLATPVFIGEAALQASGLALEERRIARIETGVPFDIDGIVFTPFPVPHDAADPMGFTVERDGVKLGVALDLGFVSKLVAERLRGCDALVLESNHDLRMLEVGPYPWALKQRVKSRRGHLSNDAVAEYLAGDFDGRARHVILAHLSQKNNHPDIARLSAQRALEGRSSLLSPQTHLDLAKPDDISRTYRF